MILNFQVRACFYLGRPPTQCNEHFAQVWPTLSFNFCLWLHATKKNTAECIQHLQAQRHKDEINLLKYKVMVLGVMAPLKNGHTFSQGNLDFQLLITKSLLELLHFPGHFLFISPVHLLSCWDNTPEATVSEQPLGCSTKVSVPYDNTLATISLCLLCCGPVQMPVLLHAEPGLWNCSSRKKLVFLSQISFLPCYSQVNAEGSMRDTAIS